MAKTYKRETAWAMLLLIAYVAIQGDSEVLEVIVWPFCLFVAAAFGMDWLGKTTIVGIRGGGKQNVTQTTTTTPE